MTAQVDRAGTLAARDWLGLGAIAGALATAAVLVTQVVAIAVWPEIVGFDPLGSYARSALFTLVPAAGATAVFAWIARRSSRPERVFVVVSAAVLVVSFAPDYLLPVPGRTFLASSVAAGLHVVAATVIVSSLIAGRRRSLRSATP